MSRSRIRSNVKYISHQFILFPWWNQFDFKKTWGPLLTRHVPIKNRAHYCVILYILRMDAVCIQSIAWNTQIGLGPFLSQRWNVNLSWRNNRSIIRQVPYFTISYVCILCDLDTYQTCPCTSIITLLGLLLRHWDTTPLLSIFISIIIFSRVPLKDIDRDFARLTTPSKTMVICKVGQTAAKEDICIKGGGGDHSCSAIFIGGHQGSSI